jgi:hypothetical protein
LATTTQKTTGLEKIIMDGYMPGRRKSGRQKIRWVQNSTYDLQITASDADILLMIEWSSDVLSGEPSSARDMLRNEEKNE